MVLIILTLSRIIIRVSSWQKINTITIVKLLNQEDKINSFKIIGIRNGQIFHMIKLNKILEKL